MCDKLVYDLAQEVEGSPSVFVRKDWINILDNQNQSYVSNQSVLDTSQLSNSNKWMSYREAYFSVPLLLTMQTTGKPVYNANTDVSAATVPTFANDGGIFSPDTTTISSDMSIGLKNWYGNIIHSFTLDYNGSTIIQQTPFVNMWNSFKLMTSLSYQDILTQGPTIGFYPDNPEAFEFYGTVGSGGTPATSRLYTIGGAGASAQYIPGSGVCNNSNQIVPNKALSSELQRYETGHGNMGFTERQKWISYDPEGRAGNYLSAGTYSQLLSASSSQLLWKSYIINKKNQVLDAAATRVQTSAGCIQYAVTATVYLKHIHSFFNMIPLLKGVFMKMTMNLNNSSCTIIAGANGTAAGAGATPLTTKYTLCSQVQSALGGSNLIMVASNNIGTTALTGQGAFNLNTLTSVTAVGAGAVTYQQEYRLNLSVGGTCLDSVINNQAGKQIIQSNMSRSIYLYIPAYTFNPTFEQAYLSSPVKQIKYTDIYQYQILGVSATQGMINNLITNGIANIKSVLVLPFYSATGTNTTTIDECGSVSLNEHTGFIAGQPVWASPFDPAGCGATSPLAHLSNFNIQISGQNAIYNLEKYTFEQFNNQLYGQNAVNGGLTDGITSSLISRHSFDLEYCYYYVNVERMLPVEQSVPKSVQIVGQNVSGKAMDYIVFVEYGVEVSIDALTGSRV